MLDHKSRRHSFRILLALLCFCLQMPGTYASGLLRLDPPSIVVLYGSSASANCTTNITHEGMGWEASQGPVDMNEHVQLITWTVKNLTHWDIKPICFINAKTQELLHLNIIVYKPPDRVSISTVNHIGPMIEGRQYELWCDVENVAPVGLLTVNWYKGQQLVKTGSISKQNSTFPQDTNSTLEITPGRGDDGVQYRCEAELNLGPEGPQPPPNVTSDPLDIIVHFGPEFSNCPDVVQLNEGQSLVGYCNVTGNPFPRLNWERDGLTIDPAIPLNRTSSGEYKIIINGNTSRILKVEMMYGPEISCGLNYTVREGEYFKPNCTVVGYPPVDVVWYKHGEVAEFPQTMYKTDAGEYILIASNNFAISNHTLEIDVWYPPYDITELENAQVSIREDVVLKCSSNAKPPPEYKWIYHQASNVQVQDQDGVSLLHITRAGGDNIGSYTCIAKNGLGEKNHTVRVNVQGAEPTCPLTISPPSVALEYGKSVNVTCTSSVSNANLKWTFSNKANVNTLEINSILLIKFLGWNGKTSCHGQFVGLDDCTKDLNVTIYKRPDQVSISTSAHKGPMIEGETYTLLCIVQNVAPVQVLTVNWYKGQDLVKNEGFHETVNPTNITSILKISPRTNSTVQYSCEAELKLGPKSSLKKKSDPLNITVHSKPSINEELQLWVPVFHGYPTVLTCKASGYPKPTITWIFNNENFNSENLTVTDKAGQYTCFASNSVGNDSRMVTVVMKEDYLPLIAGFVALVVVIISVVFICIYSIYYKNTKMGHYTVEGAKPKAQNGNVAQNGKDSTIPMKKIMV